VCPALQAARNLKVKGRQERRLVRQNPRGQALAAAERRNRAERKNRRGPERNRRATSREPSQARATSERQGSACCSCAVPLVAVSTTSPDFPQIARRRSLKMGSCSHAGSVCSYPVQKTRFGVVETRFGRD